LGALKNIKNEFRVDLLTIDTKEHFNWFTEVYSENKRIEAKMF
jgi:hypothetical protein